MNEFTFPSAAYDRDEDGYPDASASVAIHTCENCGEAAERLTRVPEFNYMGCDNCMEEALAVLAKEAAAVLAPIIPILVAMHCPVCGSTRVEKLGPFIACVNCRQLWKPAIKAVA